MWYAEQPVVRSYCLKDADLSRAASIVRSKPLLLLSGISSVVSNLVKGC